MAKTKIKAKFVDGFFDRAAVMNAVGAAKVRIFNDYGRAVRAGAQRSLKYADGPSAAGQPPHAHKSRTRTRTSKSTGKTRTRSVSFLREFLFYKYDKSTESVVIGPERLDSTVDPRSLPALEYGGPSTILDHGKRKNVTIAAHPFMHPAAAAEAPGLPERWRNSVR